MNCPPAIADVVLQILRIGLLHIRESGWQNDAVACAAQADHLHNIPSLLTDYSPELLLYYWQVERPHVNDTNPMWTAFHPLWESLERLLPPCEAVQPSANSAQMIGALPAATPRT
jgi:hypothetical protein